MLAPLREQQERERAAKGVEVERFLGIGLGAGPFQALAAEAFQLASPLAGRRVPEDRTPEAYEQAVERYLESCQGVLPAMAAQALLQEQCSRLVLRVVNRTDRNLPGVKVELVFDETVLPAEDDQEPLDLPSPPRLWGPRMEGGIAASLGYRPDLLGRIDALLPHVRQPPPDHEVSGRSVVYWVGHLRPGETYASKPVLLLIGSATEGHVTASWSATSKEVDGVVRGELHIPISAPHPLAGYLPEHPK